MRETVALLLFTLAQTASAVTVESVRMWPAPDHTRLVFDIDGPVDHTVFMLSPPARVVIDISDVTLKQPIGRLPAGEKFLERIRTAVRNGTGLRIVLDLKAPVRPKSFLLKPNQKYGHRLVVDLFVRQTEITKPAIEQISQNPGTAKLRDVVVAIDAGHGGDDPGASGPTGVREKNIVLGIAKSLAQQIKHVRGMRALLIRRGDYYVGLRKRMSIAREQRADLFISIHADAFRDPRVQGSSVYILSRNGASSEAAHWLAEQENAADLAGGVTLDDKDELLASVLLDLSQTATLSASSAVGARILRELGTIGKKHKRRVERAGFVVLKSPDIPSIMVETGFITNRDDERRLSDSSHQRRVAKAILVGVLQYFRHNAPPGTLLASHDHVITHGETLLGIAHRYRIPVSQLRAANGLTGSHIQIGDVLRIPAPQEG